MQVLINATSHKQDLNFWLDEAKETVFFCNDGAPIITEPVGPGEDIKKAVHKYWRAVLDAIDEAYAKGEVPNGVMVAGYSPLCIGIAEHCRTSRIPIYVSVAKKIENPPSWAKSPFLPQGVRWIKPAPFARVTKGRPKRGIGGQDAMVHLAPRALTDERRAEIEAFGCKIKHSATIFPEIPNGNPHEESAIVRLAVEEAASKGSAILLDSPPIEVAMHAWSVSMEQGIPIYYLSTIPQQWPLIAIPKSIEYLPW